MPANAARSMLLAIAAFGLFETASLQASGVTYVYDRLGRLESVPSSAGYTERQIDYAYDDVGNLLTRTSTLSTTDTDGDVMPGTWEQQHGLNPQFPADALLDSDQDCLTNLEDFFNWTDPRQADTATDGYVG
jgi:hypothetical protein